MFPLMKNDTKLIDIEKEIMNSNMDYNLIAYNKQFLSNEHILETFKEADELQVERYLIKKDENYIAVLDYGMSSPRFQKPWLSLLVVHQKYQGLGYAEKIYMAYEELMKNQQESYIQIAVHSTNKKALNFWASLGFIKFDERTHEGKVFFSFEKNLSY
ncbi:GNAT family N-acetyltransferase [Bacillus aquiflavi]|uniref:GNAT family N-acetyltransferase n=1 Tax=Bacillus aquiflavi TaxID=2672567 RepID=A0A6B3W0V7_9BACI|nr:GNAT family N-acetyltransferase [Bacillus aquiflavi]MBA4537336.1 GNAT family N-acetyltransferase [Bacillus aquiflavi]NEY81593.1 GNAT family N-acetyltransferase [Bacillus aquiflavi]UAC47102.1 GNAT family N-acetyltransferase [Bacillus aquiflavi]